MGKVLLVISICLLFLLVIDAAVITNNTAQIEQSTITTIVSATKANNDFLLQQNIIATTQSPNVTQISIATTISNKSTDTEVDDLNKPITNPPVTPSLTTNNDLQFTDGNDDVNLSKIESDDDVGPIQIGGNEDDPEIPLLGAQTQNNSDEKINIVSNWQSQLPAMVAGIFVILCFIGYGSLLLWRRYLEHKYGNREILINEEFYDTSDLRHFSI